MKYFFSFLISFFVLTNSFSQIIEPVEWETSVNDLGDDNFELIFKATIDPGWSIYSQNIDEGGPIPTTFTFENISEGYDLIGETEEGTPVVKFDKIFEMEMAFFFEEAVFKQRIRRTNSALKIVNVLLEYQTCDDEKCIFDSEEFEIQLISASSLTSDNSETTEVNEDTSGNDNSRSLWGIFLLAFFSGFAALLTPCVFPMIPLTVSFFTKQSKNKVVGIRNAIIYGISIVVIYVVLGSLVTAIFGSDSLNELSTAVWFNLVFFALLVVFAISFLGAFEITLPQSWANKVDSQANRGGIIGIFFMALALAIVSFSCTGPI
nr:thiol:disulfide interchange protein [Flavobacteriaceae bacterium]